MEGVGRVWSRAGDVFHIPSPIARNGKEKPTERQNIQVWKKANYYCLQEVFVVS